MGYRLAAYIVPQDSVTAASELAREAFAAIEALESPASRGPTSEYYALVVPPSKQSAAWCFTFATMSGQEIARLALRDQLRKRRAFHTLTEIDHNDKRGRYIFEHWSAGAPVRLVSVGPYLGGDLDRVTCELAQRGYSNEQLVALHRKPTKELTERESNAIMDYDNAVAIGLRWFYPGRVRYLDLANVMTGWRISNAGQPPMEADVPEDWRAGVNSEQEDDHPFGALLDWVAEAGA